MKPWVWVVSGVAFVALLTGFAVWFSLKPRELGDDVDWKSFTATFQPVSGLPSGWLINRLAAEIDEFTHKAGRETNAELRQSYLQSAEGAKRRHDHLTRESLRVSDSLRWRMGCIAVNLPSHSIGAMKLKCPPILDIIAVNPSLYSPDVLASRLREYEKEAGPDAFRQESPALADWLAKQK